MNVAQHPHAASMADPMPPPPGPPNGAYAHHMVAQSPGGPQGAQNKMELMNAIPLQQHQQQHQQQHMQPPPPQGQQGPPPPQHPQQQQPPPQQQQQPQGGPPGQAGPQPGRACERCRKTGRTCEPREGALACVGCNASRVACSLVGEIQGTTGTRRASPTKRPTNNHNANSSTSNNNKKRARSSTGPDAWEDGGDDQQQQQQPQPQHVMPGHPLAPVPMSDGNAHAMMTLNMQPQQHPKRRRTDDAEDTDIEEIREVIRDINSMHGEIGRKLNRLTKLWERKYGQAP